MAGECELGVTGLATMGANLARNAAGNGFPVAVHNRTESRTRELLDRHGNEGELVGTFSTEEFVAALARPRRILVMVKAGPAVDAVLEELAGHLDEGDLLIDGGNSYFEDTVRREQAMTARGLRFLGTGVSGGEEGALHGPSIMPGGSAEAYGLVSQLLTTIAAQVDGVPCCRLVGPGGAGHYVNALVGARELGQPRRKVRLELEVADLEEQAHRLAARKRGAERLRDTERILALRHREHVAHREERDVVGGDREPRAIGRGRRRLHRMRHSHAPAPATWRRSPAGKTTTAPTLRRRGRTRAPTRPETRRAPTPRIRCCSVPRTATRRGSGARSASGPR